jgi:hypothetical protein
VAYAGPRVQKWRNIVLLFSRRFNLPILCGDGTPVRNMPDIWPAFLIVVCSDAYSTVHDGEIIIDAVEYTDCACEIDFNISSETLQTLSVAMMFPSPY